MLQKSIFAQNLENLRKKSGWLQKEVATKIKDKYGKELKEKTYATYEQGTRTPPMDVQIQIARVFGYSADTMYTVLLPIHMVA